MSTPPAPPPRGRARTWHGESVGAGPRRALGRLSSEIEFAFRAPASTPSGETSRQIETPIQSRDYVAAMQLRKRSRPEPATELLAWQRPVDETDHRTREARLGWDINDLRQELARLRDHKRVLETRRVFRSIATRNAVSNVTAAYFNMFEHGFERGPQAARHEEFLRSVVDADVVTCSQLRGVDALLEQWRRYADFFDLREYKLRSVHATSMDATPILQIECRYHVFVTRRTLEQLFPHVLGDPYLVQRVVGKKLECDSRVTFVFDADHKIVRYDDDSDFVAAFARLLRNPFDLAVLMGRALITHHSLIGDLELQHRSPQSSPIQVT
jgi:hypothetical protein